MKLTFTFTGSPDLKALSHEDIYRMHFAVPDAALQLPDIRERVMTIANGVSQLTDAVLHFTSIELGIRDLPIKLTCRNHPWDVGKPYILLLRFSRHLQQSAHNEYRDLKVLMPVDSHRSVANWRALVAPSYVGRSEAEKAFVSLVQQVGQQCALLLNSEPPPPQWPAWEYFGFHPNVQDASLRRRFNKRQKKLTRLQEKQRELEAQTFHGEPVEQSPVPSTPTGTGRRVGAVPGKFKGVQFRSQLEIRFVAELEARHIRWTYESERLGEGNYLVDFHLPDLKCWVEVKGRVEPRDDYLLKDVAAYLQRERGQRLFVYTQSKAFTVTSEDIKPLSHNDFWSRLVS